MKCSHCSTDNATGGRFCTNCGGTLTTTSALATQEKSQANLPTAASASAAPSVFEPAPLPTEAGPASAPIMASEPSSSNHGQPAPAPNITIINQQGSGGGFNSAVLGVSDKSPALALVLSIVICGAGQMYNGQVLKGVVMLFSCVVLWFMLLGWIMNLWSMIDAYSTAKRMHMQWLLAISNGGSHGQVARA